MCLNHFTSVLLRIIILPMLYHYVHFTVFLLPYWFFSQTYKLSFIQDSPDKCPMPINAAQNSSIDPNVDQCGSIAINADQSSQFLSIPMNADQCQSMPDQLMFYWCLDPALIDIDRNWEELGGIDRHWSTMIGIERHFGSMPWFWSHW